jgi:hypothetical protein
VLTGTIGCLWKWALTARWRRDTASPEGFADQPDRRVHRDRKVIQAQQDPKDRRVFKVTQAQQVLKDHRVFKVTLAQQVLKDHRVFKVTLALPGPQGTSGTTR